MCENSLLLAPSLNLWFILFRFTKISQKKMHIPLAAFRCIDPSVASFQAGFILTFITDQNRSLGLLAIFYRFSAVIRNLYFPQSSTKTRLKRIFIRANNRQVDVLLHGKPQGKTIFEFLRKIVLHRSWKLKPYGRSFQALHPSIDIFCRIFFNNFAERRSCRQRQ